MIRTADVGAVREPEDTVSDVPPVSPSPRPAPGRDSPRDPAGDGADPGGVSDQAAGLGVRADPVDAETSASWEKSEVRR